jgi:hypothetical protein
VCSCMKQSLLCYLTKAPRRTAAAATRNRTALLFVCQPFAEPHVLCARREETNVCHHARSLRAIGVVSMLCKSPVQGMAAHTTHGTCGSERDHKTFKTEQQDLKLRRCARYCALVICETSWRKYSCKSMLIISFRYCKPSSH